MAFLEYYNELVGLVPALSPIYAQTLVNRAWRDIQDSRSWSFLIEEGVLSAPASVTTGTVSISQGSKTLTPSATAITAWDALGAIIPIGTRQIRFSSTGRIYNIDSYNGATAELKETFTETSLVDSSYTLFKCYYSAPSSDFRRFMSVVDMVDGRSLRLHLQKKQLDQQDPQRSTSEQPFCLASYKADSSGLPLYELYPHPTTARNYLALYQRQGSSLSEDTDAIPATLPTELLMARAKYHAFEWAGINGVKGVEGGAVDWRFWAAKAQKDYLELLQKAMRQDDEIFLQNVLVPHRRSFAPPSASYMQNHSNWS